MSLHPCCYCRLWTWVWFEESLYVCVCELVCAFLETNERESHYLAEVTAFQIASSLGAVSSHYGKKKLSDNGFLPTAPWLSPSVWIHLYLIWLTFVNSGGNWYRILKFCQIPTNLSILFLDFPVFRTWLSFSTVVYILTPCSWIGLTLSLMITHCFLFQDISKVSLSDKIGLWSQTDWALSSVKVSKGSELIEAFITSKWSLDNIICIAPQTLISHPFL